MPTRKFPDIPFTLPQVTTAQKRRAKRLADALAGEYPDAHCELDFDSPLQLLLATILSAQATDVGVNRATPALFARFKSAADFAAATPEQIEPYIKTIGLYRNKAKAIHATCTALVEHFDGRVPGTMPELLTLKGVARKTANVVLGNAFHTNVGFVVDTHIARLARRFELVPAGTTTQMTERFLMALFPQDRWCDLSHQLIFHGRRACKARCPKQTDAHTTGCHDHPICTKFGTACECRRPRP